MTTDPCPELSETHAHRVHGLHLRCDFPCPELQPAPAGAASEVRITLGETPAELPDASRLGIGFAIAPGQALIAVARVARFWIRDGRAIVVQPAPEAAPEEVRLFLYGTPFAALLLQRGCLPLSGATVARGDAALAICGPTGSGRSTLAGALVRRGWRLLSEEPSCLGRTPEGLVALPGPPFLKLWEDAVRGAGVDPGSLRRIRPTLRKYFWRPDELPNPAGAPLRALVVLGRRNEPGSEVTPIGGAEKFQLLGAHTAGRQLLRMLPDRSELFSLWSALAQRTPCWRVVRSASGQSPDALADLVEELWR